jgi:hypothetical protein
MIHNVDGQSHIRVKELRDLINRGEYHLDPKAVADAILRHGFVPNAGRVTAAPRHGERRARVTSIARIDQGRSMRSPRRAAARAAAL